MQHRKPVVSDPVQFIAADTATPEAALVISVSDDTVGLKVCNSGGTWRDETSVQRERSADDTGRRWRFAPHHTQQ